jgi:hypothetical protein
MGMSWRTGVTRTTKSRRAVGAGTAAPAFGLVLVALLVTPATALALGSLSGTVTAAVGGQPLAGVEVCAESVGVTDVRECVATGGDGKYQVAGLEPGNYKVGFWPSVVSGYLPRYYDGKPSSGEAKLVLVVNAADIFGIDATLLEEELAGGGGTVSPASPAGESAPAAPSPPITAPPVVAPKPASKTCRKGWRKVRVQGKAVCRKVQPKGKGRVARPRER